ncbi:RrF2 family transcriptional regulator [Ohessyouella blattaphilus]|uniref:Rrf2 family transcriptional regulator n=1 Tax=Ohessyouella blattaphilus TaxID=2949333 RepID=A0ABT1ENC5_9FIRM|nr:Rrf2 family transcriptional regulator [Ohessyouella blattaphilus]MCP1111211.1 Rrf2 family transcriptional regulator [Ohessyouella blattaphilus]MCR8564605.1 Rrf2 family transcriptional regulator [Ohessyouella blattaphilus]
MKLSTKGRYGLRAIIDLARFGKEAPVSISSIAARQGISEGYLEQIVALLKKAELVKSVRGAGGGYVLAKEANEISVGDILRALEGDLDAVNCSAEGGCTVADECVTKYVWRKINDSINHTVDEMLLSKLAEESEDINPDGEFENQCK